MKPLKPGDKGTIESAKKARRKMRRHVSCVLESFGLYPEVYIWPPKCDPAKDRIIVREGLFAETLDESIGHALSSNGISFTVDCAYMPHISIPIDQEALPL